ncbi:SMP-30/gluconolactonase/LRE family protein [Winogradskyella alexanderae]|uniref:SMP-30/gluconolactonase/LRE family protein n=1 Tax=Winogradskyella alexanderae TaxID=2877123 RepID=A0ABS7XUK2_9FLAO|nr:SMP-30/gluconolactonase/LRE family protein [Winogradskyella alexanderae]MCA0133103.1 SMP-30/gluconolactonase/LRE family protein [Winogradskyella alexanderae]
MDTSLIFYSNEAELFEGPIFDTNYNLLYFVSILDCLVYCYSPKTKEILSVKLDSPTSNVYLTSTEKTVLVASKNGFYELDFNTLETSFKFQLNIPENVRYNDGISDPIGRFIIGTMGYPEVINGIGNVYSFHKGKSNILINNTTISNGLAFSNEGKYLYFIDTPTKKVAKYRYDIERGSVDFSSFVIEFTGEGSPDGMCIDENGMLWIAEWGGSCVSQWDPESGDKLNVIKLPHKNVTSCCFDNDKNLFITTAKDTTDPKSGSGLYFVKQTKI